MAHQFILPAQERSYWLEGFERSSYPQLRDDIAVDVAVVGGGIAGLNTAYLLKQAGLTVAVIEKHTIGSGTSGGSTGKVTTQHGLIYEELAGRFGAKAARCYAAISRQAFDGMESLIRKRRIRCDWRRADNYVYTADPRNIPRFRREARVAARFGLPASFETGLDLPFDVAAAVRFTGQANFHILKYLHALAELIDGGGSFVFENSNATGIRGGRGGQPGRVKTAHGSVMARSVVVATKVPAAPLAARFTYGSAEYPTTSYLVAGKYTGRLKGMYISPDPGQYSLLPVGSGRERLLLIGGENHIPGLGRPLRRHRKLAAYGQERFGIDRFEYRWKAMDYLAYDGLPLAGRLYSHSRNTYAISGLKKWGLNLSMVAAIVIRDLITGQPQPTADLFDPHRGGAPRAIPKAVAGYLADRLG